MKDFIKLARDRYSVRSFSDKKIGQDKVDLILKAAQVAPTARNFQPQRLLVLQSQEALEKWRRCTVCHFNEQLVILVCYNSEESSKRSYDGQDSGFIDGSIIMTHMMMESWDLGIGSTWVMNFDPEAVRREFALEPNLVPVSALTMGYAADDACPNPRHSQRKPLEETVKVL